MSSPTPSWSTSAAACAIAAARTHNDGSADALIAALPAGALRPLVPPRALRTVRAVARRWPVARGALFECRLAADATDAAVDFSLCVGSAPGEREAWARALERTRPAPGTPSARLAAVMAEWADRSTPLGRVADTIWLEFDLADCRDCAVCPSPFFVQLR